MKNRIAEIVNNMTENDLKNLVATLYEEGSEKEEVNEEIKNLFHEVFNA